MTKRRAPVEPDHASPVVMPVPADIDKAYVEKRGSRAAKASRLGVGGFTPATAGELKASALTFLNHYVKCKTDGCNARRYQVSDWCKMHKDNHRISVVAKVGPEIPGLCNQATKSGGFVGKRCRQPAEKCVYHKNIPALPDYLK